MNDTKERKIVLVKPVISTLMYTIAAALLVVCGIMAVDLENTLALSLVITTACWMWTARFFERTACNAANAYLMLMDAIKEVEEQRTDSINDLDGTKEDETCLNGTENDKAK